MTGTTISCPHGPGPARECYRCTPPALFTPTTPPDDDPFGFVLDEAPPVAARIAVGGVGVAAVVVIVGTSAVVWAAGVVVDALRGRL